MSAWQAAQARSRISPHRSVLCRECHGAGVVEREGVTGDVPCPRCGVNDAEGNLKPGPGIEFCLVCGEKAVLEFLEGPHRFAYCSTECAEEDEP